MTNTNLKISYKPLWKQLIDKEMTKTQLQELVGLSPGTLAKLGKDGNINTDTLVKICAALQCQITDVCEVVNS